jgi:UDP-N-acetylglucosamine:LPS N-acetylglucosamine transferase
MVKQNFINSDDFLGSGLKNKWRELKRFCIKLNQAAIISRKYNISVLVSIGGRN